MQCSLVNATMQGDQGPVLGKLVKKTKSLNKKEKTGKLQQIFSVELSNSSNTLWIFPMNPPLPSLPPPTLLLPLKER